MREKEERRSTIMFWAQALCLFGGAVVLLCGCFGGKVRKREEREGETSYPGLNIVKDRRELMKF